MNAESDGLPFLGQAVSAIYIGGYPNIFFNHSLDTVFVAHLVQFYKNYGGRAKY